MQPIFLVGTRLAPKTQTSSGSSIVPSTFRPGTSQMKIRFSRNCFSATSWKKLAANREPSALGAVCGSCQFSGIEVLLGRPRGSGNALPDGFGGAGRGRDRAKLPRLLPVAGSSASIARPSRTNRNSPLEIHSIDPDLALGLASTATVGVSLPGAPSVSNRKGVDGPRRAAGGSGGRLRRRTA